MAGIVNGFRDGRDVGQFPVRKQKALEVVSRRQVCVLELL
jgi:hypothetical protein